MPGALSPEAEAFLASLRASDRAANTLDAYRRDLVSYERWLVARRLSVAAAGEPDVAAYVGTLTEAGRRPASIARALVSVRALHRWCGSDAARRVGGPDVPAGGGGACVLGPQEVVALLDAVAGGDAVARRDRALLELLYATGARISEVVGLSLGDVGGGVARLGGRNARPVPYGEAAAEALEAWLSPDGRARLAGGGVAVFVNQRGGRLSRQWGWSVVRAAGDRVGLGTRLGPHGLRHAFAAHLAARGAPAGALQQLLVGQPLALGPDELVERYRRWHPRAVRAPSPGRPGSHYPGEVADEAQSLDPRVQLELERDTLVSQLAELGVGEGGSLTYDSNFADSSQVTAERGEAEALAASLRETLGEVEHALGKLDEGNYGQCEGCGQPIDPARLEAKPAARFCMECASRR